MVHQYWRTRHNDLKIFSQVNLGNVAKFGEHSLNSFEIIQLFSKGGPLKPLPRPE